MRQEKDKPGITDSECKQDGKHGEWECILEEVVMLLIILFFVVLNFIIMLLFYVC